MSQSSSVEFPPAQPFTGERFVPGLTGSIVYEHVHRYAFALHYVAGRRVLDIACGEGYGSNILASEAEFVVGLDVDLRSVSGAARAYNGTSNLTFACGSGTRIPLPDASMDVVVSFETIEHLAQADQPALISEIARVLKPNGMLILSAPNRPEYSESRQYVNPFHLHEHDRVELEVLIAREFPFHRWFSQRIWLGSMLWQDQGGDSVEHFEVKEDLSLSHDSPPPMYFVVVAARAAAVVPLGVRVSLLSDKGESELRRFDNVVRDAIRLDGLLVFRENLIAERDMQLRGANARIDALEALCNKFEPMVVERERLIVERDLQLADANERIDQISQRAEELARLIAERDALLQAANAHVIHLEEIAAFREQLVVERDRALAKRDEQISAMLGDAKLLESDRAKAVEAAAQRDRDIANLRSFSGWLQYPMSRAKQALRTLVSRPTRRK